MVVFELIPIISCCFIICSSENMPKKFKGENSKAVEAKARKASQKAEEADRKAQAAEDARWEDDDKHVMRKQQRKVWIIDCMNPTNKK